MVGKLAVRNTERQTFQIVEVEKHGETLSSEFERTRFQIFVSRLGRGQCFSIKMRHGRGRGYETREVKFLVGHQTLN